MKWEEVKLGELYTVHNGLSKSKDFFGSGFPFLSFSTVFKNYFIPEKIIDLVQSSETERKTFSIKKGDVFITRTSETIDELGMSCVALRDIPNATYNGFTKRMRPIDSNKVCPKYIGYFLRTSYFRNKFIAFSNMTTRASLKNEDLLSMTIFLPPYPVQQKIAGILSAYDDLIENNQKQIKLLEEAAQRLYKEWFVDFRFPGHETAKFINGLPEGWRKGTLSELGQFKRGKTITKEQTVSGSVPVVAGGLEPAYYHNQSNTESPVVTVSASGANAGFTRMYFKKIWASDCSFIDCKLTENLFFMYVFLKKNPILLKNLQKGSAQPHVYPTHLNNLLLIIPAKDLLKKFCYVVTPIFSKLGTLDRQISILQEARDRLLPKLMNGEIEV